MFYQSAAIPNPLPTDKKLDMRGAVTDQSMSFSNTIFDAKADITAIRAKDGSRVWSTGTSGRAFQQSGEFYSTPAVSNGRVYLGNTDGFVYSFTARDGQLAWRHATGAYVYSSAAVGPGPNGTPTVFIGGYDRTFYAFDARSGNVLWTYSAPGRISGAPDNSRRDGMAS